MGTTPIRYDPHENVPFGDATEQNVEDLTEERESDDDVEIVFVDVAGCTTGTRFISMERFIQWTSFAMECSECVKEDMDEIIGLANSPSRKKNGHHALKEIADLAEMLG